MWDEVKALDEDLSDDFIDLISENDQRFTVSHQLAKMSNYIKSIIDMDICVKEIRLSNIHSSTLEQILTWLRYHDKEPAKPIPIPLSSSNLKNIVGQWDAEFIDLTLEEIYKLLIASNFLAITSLLELCCAKIASLMIGKTPNKIRDTFGIPEVFGPEEEEKFKREFADYL